MRKTNNLFSSWLNTRKNLIKCSIHKIAALTFSMVSIGVVLAGPGLVCGVAWVPAPNISSSNSPMLRSGLAWMAAPSRRMVRKTSMMIPNGSFYSAPCETANAFLNSQFKHVLGCPAEEEKSVGWGYPYRKNAF